MKHRSVTFGIRRVFAAATVVALLGTSANAEGPTFAVRAKGYVDPDGEVVRNVTLLVEDGKIKKIGKRVRAPKDWIVLNRSGEYLAPGLVEIHSAVGAMRRTGEAANSIEAGADAADLFNQYHHDFDRAARAGITTIVLAPSSAHLVGGVTAVVKTGGSDHENRVVSPGPLKLSLTAQAFAQERVPTSLQGALATLRDMIATARANKDDASPFAHWARGETAAIVDVEDAATLRILARFAREHSLKCIALHANEAADRIEDAQSLGMPVILGTYEFHDPFRYTRVPGLLEKAGVAVAFTSEPPRYAPELLRVGAAIAMSEGMSRKAALAGMTSVPAGIVGLSNRIGSIEVGKDADFIVMDGDPLRLSSRVEEVFIGGERVFDWKAESERSASGVR